MTERTLIGLVLLGALVPAGAIATVLIPLGLEDLADRAPVVVLGEVNQVMADWNAEKTKIYTRVLVTPSEVLRGPASPGTLTLKLIGGTVGDVTAELVGTPRFEVGERVLLFLEPRKDGDGYLLQGLYQGKYQVFRDPSTGRDLCLREPAPGKVRSADGIDLAPIERARPLDEVRALVRRGGAR